MQIKPHGFNVMVRPDEPPKHEGLIATPEAYESSLYSSGVVIAIGDGSLARFQARQKAMKQCLDVVRDAEATLNFPASLQIVREDIARLMGTGHESSVKVGQRILFSPHDYIETSVNGETYVVVSEDNILAVYEAGLESVA